MQGTLLRSVRYQFDDFSLRSTEFVCFAQSLIKGTALSTKWNTSRNHPCTFSCSYGGGRRTAGDHQHYTYQNYLFHLLPPSPQIVCLVASDEHDRTLKKGKGYGISGRHRPSHSDGGLSIKRHVPHQSMRAHLQARNCLAMQHDHLGAPTRGGSHRAA